jgi:cephalosporin hydroxylase/SAM-dependent methyltransferase
MIEVPSRSESDADEDRTVRRYLDLLRAALLDQHYLENELRIELLMRALREGEEPHPQMLANPSRYMARALRIRDRERAAGDLPPNHQDAPDSPLPLAYAGLGRTRLVHLESVLNVIRDEDVPGDLVDVGTGRGGAAIFMRGFLEAYAVPDRRVWVIDRFDGGEATGADGGDAFPPDLNTVREGFARFDLLDERVVLLQSDPPSALEDARLTEISLLRVDGLEPAELEAALEAAYDRVVPGGFVVIDDYNAPDRQEVVDRFRAGRGIADPVERVDWSAGFWRKTGDRAEAPIPLRTPAAKDLSVVVVLYDMLREARRTLHSLTRSYQQGIEGLDYEVIVVDNGSAPEQRLGQDLVESFGPEFRYIDLGEESAPSPARAVNRGIAASGGAAIAVMIDGAHMLTPGVLRLGMLGLSTYAPAVVTARQWYLGPGQQPQVVAEGYDREQEDRLLDEIGWPADGYQLFEIGHFIGPRDWFDGEWESNCIFVPRELIDQVGAMDERFSVPGGGFVNLDFFERVASAPGVQLVTMLGEGSFHQVHGGTTTNFGRPEEREALIQSFGEQYAELRGRKFKMPEKHPAYVGTLPPPARRTRRRRFGTDRFRVAHLNDRRPSQPAPIPQDLRAEFADAYWRSDEAHRSKWLGRPTHHAPTDLLAYQELVFRLRPDWIVETRTGTGGRALFLATICDLIDNGRVLSIGDQPLGSPPAHPRITYVTGDPTAQATAARVRELVGDRPHAMVIVGAARATEVIAAFRNYAPLVSVGSYVVIEDTVIDGVGAWPGFGRGPAAAAQVIAEDGDFVPDPARELGLSLNSGGFLKRVR